MNIRLIQLYLGLTLLVFILTGYYMRVHPVHGIQRPPAVLDPGEPGLHSPAWTIESGTQLKPAKARGCLAGSAFIVASTATAIYAVFFEDKTSLNRPFVLLTAAQALSGILMQVAGSFTKTSFGNS